MYEEHRKGLGAAQKCALFIINVTFKKMVEQDIVIVQVTCSDAVPQ